MKLTGFQVNMYKCIQGSGWIEVTPLTVLVGRNESGKTSILKALHKFNPYNAEPYSMDREWPRAFRDKRDEKSVVCTAEFELSDDEIETLRSIAGETGDLKRIKITKDYGGRFEVQFPVDLFPDRMHPNDIDAACDKLPEVPHGVSNEFQRAAQDCREEAVRFAREGRFTELAGLSAQHSGKIQVRSPSGLANQHENNFKNQYLAAITQLAQQLQSALSIHKKAHDYIVQRIPTFVYMDEYRSFQGSAILDQVKQRLDRKQETEADKTLLMILSLSGLEINAEVAKGGQPNREDRQYDLDDAGKTLSRKIGDHWKQLRYEVTFRADGQEFFTFVKDPKDVALIKLEERSKGFQWFFSFDLMLMHETQGTLKNCVILLDEPGLHLHPKAQSDLIARLEQYASDNTLIYTTHLPFMIDLKEPDRIRVIKDSTEGSTVSYDLTDTPPEAKLVLQTALEISGSTSYLVADRNLLVEGVDDYWIITELSNLLRRSGKDGLPDDILITPCGGASEVTYIATFMVGQNLGVVALFDTDLAGNTAKDKFVKNWLARYKDRHAAALSLGQATGASQECFSIEDMFPEDFYLQHTKAVYDRQLAAANITEIKLNPGAMLATRIEQFFKNNGLQFNKGSVAKRICAAIRTMESADELPKETAKLAAELMKNIAKAFSEDRTKN